MPTDDVTFEQVVRALQPEEPDYDEAAALGPGALPHLQRLVERGDPDLGSKAAYLAGLLGVHEAVPILETAAASGDPGIRAAAAGGARHLPGRTAEPLLLVLIDDQWAGVRKTALKAVSLDPGPELTEKVNARRTIEPELNIRNLADDVFNNLRPEP